MTELTRETLLAWDAADPLAPFRDQFDLPQGVIYLDGNSLGALPRAARERVRQVVESEWGMGLIRSWNTAGWIELPSHVGAQIAQLVGAEADEVIVADSTSINLFKALAAALALRPERRVILAERDSFPTDLYIAQGLAAWLGRGHTLRLVEAEEVVAAMDEHTAAVVLGAVNYRTGALFDLAAVTRAAHACGTVMIWDLAHAAGVIPVRLNAVGADFAVGCGYKYLNGGPGAPAFIFVARRHHAAFHHPLSGWMGHAQPFAFEVEYRPAEGVQRALCGTPPILSLAALEVGVALALQADLNVVREKSMRLTEAFIALVEQRCAERGLTVLSPRRAAERGSQVALSHPHAYPVMQALVARGVIGDVRAPNVLRFGFAPLYVRYVDVWDAVEVLRQVLDEEAWQRSEYQQRAAVI